MPAVKPAESPKGAFGRMVAALTRVAIDCSSIQDEAIQMNTKQQALQSPLFEALAEIAFTSVMVTRASGEQGASEIVYVNDQFTELTGFGAEEVMGKTPGMLQGPKTDSRVLERLENDLAEDRIFHGRTMNYRKDGSEFEMEWKVKRVLDIEGVAFYIAVQREAG